MAYYKCATVFVTDNSVADVYTASGSIANFNTQLSMPVNLKASFIATQEAGTPTPQSPKAISGVSAVNGTKCGANLFDIKPYNEWDISTAYAMLRNSVPNKVIQMSLIDNDTSVDISGIYFGFCVSNFSGGTSLQPSEYRWTIRDGVVENNRTNLSVQGSNVLTALMLYPKNEQTYNKFFSRFKVVISPNIVTSYEAYNGNDYEIVFPLRSEIAPYFEGLLNGTYDFVDLGSLDWSLTAGTRFAASEISSIIKVPENTSIKANMIVSAIYTVETAGHVVGDATLYDRCIAISSFNGNIFITNSAYSDATAFGDSLNGIYLIYELATPKTPTITPEQLATLKMAFAATSYYGGYVEQDKGGHRKLVITESGLVNLNSLTYYKAVLVGQDIFYADLPNGLIKGTGANNLVGLCTTYKKVDSAALNNFECRLYSHTDWGGFSRIGIRDDNVSAMTGEEFKAYVTGSVIYELAEPFTIALPDGQPISAFVGTNNIFNDSSTSEVAYTRIGAPPVSLSKGPSNDDSEEEEKIDDSEPKEEEPKIEEEITK